MDDHRRFLEASDFLPLNQPNDLRQAFWLTLDSAIQPVFDAVYPDIKEREIYLDKIEDADQDVMGFGFRFGYHSDLIDGEQTDISDAVAAFAGKKKRIMAALKKALMPAISAEMLNAHGLSEDQFVAQTIAIDVKPFVSVYVHMEDDTEPRDRGNLSFDIIIEIYLRIEDVSELQPGEIQALRLKYVNLCRSNTTMSFDELKEWAHDIGIADVDNMSKPTLCAAVRDHYGFV